MRQCKEEIREAKKRKKIDEEEALSSLADV